jgi:glyoxylase I family protein
MAIAPQEHPHGRFARLHDPQGNPLALWEPQ